MLTHEQNELLTRIGPGTPMGSLLREYWLPACRAAKVEPEGAPERVRIVGENFVAFRGTDGRVGFIREACPHRCASMALARNEGDGLRCIFHGWKVSLEGRCVDTPTEPPERREAFAAKVPVESYPVREAGGLIWVYLGKQASPPRFPEFEFTALPADQVMPRRGLLHANWLQGLEALLDSAHVSFLHRAQLGPLPDGAWRKEIGYLRDNGAPRFEFVERPYGFTEGALRDQDDGVCYARVREVALPFFSFIPTAAGGSGVVVCAIPIDDEWTAQWYIAYDVAKPLNVGWMTQFNRDAGDPDYFNSDMGTRENLWNQDREAMKNGHWSGIVGHGNAYEDFVVQESMGPIIDRSREFLASCDHVIIRARSQLLRAVERFGETGEVAFAGPEVDYRRIRAISFSYPQGGDWRTVDAMNPPKLEAAE
jgi:phenylpropionate dioxygenase-like ring-hydroxylating dioxygenase large terminal subunit